jgi:hypothetical protein
MSKEATSVEAKVTGLTLDHNGVAWAQISYYEPIENTEGGQGAPAVAPPTDYYSINIRASQLPGIQLGDKVQVALYLK